MKAASSRENAILSAKNEFFRPKMHSRHNVFSSVSIIIDFSGHFQLISLRDSNSVGPMNGEGLKCDLQYSRHSTVFVLIPP